MVFRVSDKRLGDQYKRFPDFHDIPKRSQGVFRASHSEGNDDGNREGKEEAPIDAKLSADDKKFSAESVMEGLLYQYLC